MKKEIRIVKGGVMQITLPDERWYVNHATDQKTGNPIYEYWPSTSWIASFYPKDIHFMKWLASKGWDEAEAIKMLAGNRGSKVHYAVESLLTGHEVTMKDKFINPTTNEPEELSVDEYSCVIDFVNWFKSQENIEILGIEITHFNNEHRYGGTIDLLCRIDGQLWVLDLKTSKSIYQPHKLQISAYGHLDVPLKTDGYDIGIKEWDNRKLAILQIGYKRNKDRFKFTEIDDCFNLFLATKQIWANECAKVHPPQLDLPLKVKLDLEEVIKPKVAKKINKK